MIRPTYPCARLYTLKTLSGTWAKRSPMRYIRTHADVWRIDGDGGGGARQFIAEDTLRSKKPTHTWNHVQKKNVHDVSIMKQVDNIEPATTKCITTSRRETHRRSIEHETYWVSRGPCVQPLFPACPTIQVSTQRSRSE